MSGRILPMVTSHEMMLANQKRAAETRARNAAAAAIWPDPAFYTPAFFGPHYRGYQITVDELRALNFPGTMEVWAKACAKMPGGPAGYETNHIHCMAFGPALNWVKGQAKLVARRRVFGRCQPGGQCSAHKNARHGICRGPCAEEPAYTEAFEALVLAEMPAALAEKEAAVTAEALRRIKAEAAAAAAAAEKQRVETARITALARQRIKQAAEKAAEEAAIQLEMARLLSTDETVAARIQLRGAELSGLF
jgi:hypothetical protein